ncbi:MAG: reverse transcriptase-like protein [Candidatus Kariarchaeaceae archaeon]
MTYGSFKVYNVDGDAVAHRQFVLGSGTNNSAEYEAMIRAMEWCIENDIKEIVILTDSMLVVRQMSGDNECYEPRLMRLLRRAKKLEEKIGNVRIRWVDNKFVKQKLGH